MSPLNRSPHASLSVWLVILAAGCGDSHALPPTMAPSEVAADDTIEASPVASASAANSAVPTEESKDDKAGPAILGYRRVWTEKTDGWNHVVAVAPFGDVVTIGSYKIRVHARDTGKVLESAKFCDARAPQALAFWDDRTAVVACSNEIRTVTFPGLTSQEVHRLKESSDAAAATKDWVATGTDEGDVQLVRTGSWKVGETFKLKNGVETIALSRDGKFLAVGTKKKGEVHVRSVRRGSPLRKVTSGDRRATGLAFSPNNDTVFVNQGIFRADVVSRDGGTLVRRYRVGSWISSAAYLSPSLVAATGSDGFFLHPLDRDKQVELPFPDRTACEGLGASRDGTQVCAGDRNGTIVCYSSRAVAPSTYRAAASSAAPAFKSDQAAAPVVLGVIRSRAGKTVTLTVSETGSAAPGSKGKLFRRLETTFGTAKVSAWLTIADVTVQSVSSGSVVVRIERTQSHVMVNKKPVNHFSPGTSVKLELGK